MILRPKRPTFLGVLLYTVLSLAGTVSAEFDPDKRYRLNPGETREVEAELKVSIHTPRLKAREWVLVSPVPPTLPSQTSSKARMAVYGRPARAEGSPEESLLRRPVLTVRLPVKSSKRNSGIEFSVFYDVTLRPRRLAEGAMFWVRGEGDLRGTMDKDNWRVTNKENKP